MFIFLPSPCHIHTVLLTDNGLLTTMRGLKCQISYSFLINKCQTNEGTIITISSFFSHNH